MAANQAQFNNYLQQVLGIESQGLREALNAEGLDSFAALSTMEDDGIVNACKHIRNPGGMIPNPNAAAQGQPAQVPNRGHPIGSATEKRLRQLRYFHFHHTRVQRPFQRGEATLLNLNTFWKRFKDEEEDQQLDKPGKLTRMEDVRKTLVNIDQYLMEKRGAYGSPLAYVVRSIPNVADQGVDPGLGNPSIEQELINRTHMKDMNSAKTTKKYGF